MSNILQKSRDLHDQAKKLLFDKGLHDLFSKYGEVLYAGSYALDLLVWKDIDLNIIVEKEKMAAITKALVSELLDNPLVQRIKVFRDLHKKYDGKMPDGNYLGLLIGSWKMDIFVVDEKEAQKTKEKTRQVQEKLTKDARKTILEVKQELLLPSGRTPKFSGMYIYEAVLDKKLKTKKEVLQYLVLHGYAIK